jgi:RimJ/RimL family protein N-acetyltransferase
MAGWGCPQCPLAEAGEEFPAMASVPTIETPRLRLRDWRDDDVEAWIAMNADPRVTEFFARPSTREGSESRAGEIREELTRRGYGWWVVEIRGGPAFAGVICLRDVPFAAHFTPAREIGWRFAPANWGHGYATEGARAALDFAFTRLQWDEVVAMTVPTNLRSRRVMERLGMRRDPADDFDHPNIARGHRLRRHVLYRIDPPTDKGREK